MSILEYLEPTYLKSVLDKLNNVNVALSSRASEATLSGIKAQTDKLVFDALSRLRINAEVVANPPNLDVLLSSRASESTLTLVRNLISDIDIGLSGYDVAYPRHDGIQWRDPATYTVTETTWTEKTRLSYRPRATRSAGYFIRFAIWGYVSAPGQTMYVRVRSWHRGVLGTVTFTETLPTLNEIRAYYQKALWWDDPIIFEAHVAGAGQTGYITYVDANFIPIEGLIHGILPDLSDLRALRVDTDGFLLQGLNKVGGVVLTGRDWSSDFARLQNIDIPLGSRLDVALSSRASETTLSNLYNEVLNNTWQKIRVGRIASPSWIYGSVTTAPAAESALASVSVPAGKSGYIYGYLISATEENQFEIRWTSGGTGRAIRIVFPSAGSVHGVSLIALNEGLPADAGTTISIVNISAGSSGQVYQAGLLVAFV
jgi:hypothetical protein